MFGIVLLCGFLFRNYSIQKMEFAKQLALHNANPPHQFNAKRGFWVGKYEISELEFSVVFPINKKSDKFPITGVYYSQAVLYCNELSKVTGRRIRLLTEDEWEYACRGNSCTNFCSGDDTASLSMAGWFGENSGGQLHSQGEKAPNEFGLYDMLGNVSELCTSSDVDGSRAVLKGGSYLSRSLDCASAMRIPVAENITNSRVGFRILVEVPPEPTEDAPIPPPPAPGSDPKTPSAGLRE